MHANFSNKNRMTEIGSRPKPQVASCRGLRRTVLSKERYGESLWTDRLAF